MRNRHFNTTKVPDVNVTFWLLKVLSTAMGEATSDFLVHRFSPVLAVLGGAVIFSLVLIWQLRSPRFRTSVYWSTVVMVSVFGTMCADVVHVGFHVPYVISSITFAVALVGVFTSWYLFEATLSIHSITTLRRELFYWASVTVTFALGTAAGDMVASTLRLGYLRAGLLFGVLIALVAMSYPLLHTYAIATFWVAYVLTRPLGASFADWWGVAPQRGGLNEGPGTVGLILTGVIVLVVALTLARERTAEKTPISLG